MPTACRNDAYFKRFPCLYQYFELSYAGVRARLETHISTQSAERSLAPLQARTPYRRNRADRRQCARCSRRGLITQRDSECPASGS
jgi:hypothetical protein